LEPKRMCSQRRTSTTSFFLATEEQCEGFLKAMAGELQRVPFAGDEGADATDETDEQ